MGALFGVLAPLLAPVLSGLLRLLSGGLLDQVVGLLRARQDREGQRDRLDTEAAMAAVQAELEARRAAADIVRAEQGWWLTAMIRPLFVLPLAVWWAAVILDSIGRFAWSVAALPAPLDEWAGWIIAGYFLTAPFVDRRRR